MKCELMPTNGAKSFYGKCYVEKDENGNEVLYSYGTKIMKRKADGALTRSRGLWSATTGRHIKAFCGLNKSEFMKLTIEA